MNKIFQETNRPKLIQAFSLLEVLIVTLILGILIAHVIAFVDDAIRKSRGKASTSNILAIERAKEAWIYEYPSKIIIPSEDDLGKYLGGKIPQCPSGLPYDFILDCSKVTEAQANGKKEFEPNVAPLERNGFFDLH